MLNITNRIKIQNNIQEKISLMLICSFCAYAVTEAATGAAL